MSYDKTIYRDENYERRLFFQNLTNFCDRHGVTYDLKTGYFFLMVKGKFYCLSTQNNRLDEPNIRVIHIKSLGRIQEVVLALEIGLALDNTGELVHREDLKALRKAKDDELRKRKKKKGNHYKKGHN